ncbi:pyridoxamine 5'-phosphate oxidase family protein [Pseudooceanicola sp. 200-1SW]|uniref:pyridoxamine 5'-phosphate oxidase family protein n=1 Tax=Pseudooceanicola sp. 200-1SW TaxID=3425949 RepID=UPI003D7FAB17
MEYLDRIEDLEEIYGTSPAAAALRKVATRMTPEYRRWIATSRFCVVSTVGPEGVDGSPRGDDGPVVRELDEGHLALPDWHGNNRIDTLRNILRDPRMALMFMVPGSNNVVRVNGRGRVTADAALRASFAHKGKEPRTVVVMQIDEIYFQCARAVMRAGLWSGRDDSAALPTPGEILAAMTDGEVGGADYDRAWPERAAQTLW